MFCFSTFLIMILEEIIIKKVIEVSIVGMLPPPQQLGYYLRHSAFQINNKLRRKNIFDDRNASIMNEVERNE